MTKLQEVSCQQGFISNKSDLYFSWLCPTGLALYAGRFTRGLKDQLSSVPWSFYLD